MTVTSLNGACEYLGRNTKHIKKNATPIPVNFMKYKCAKFSPKIPEI